MKSVSKAIIIGNLGQDPREIKTTTGTAMVALRVATSTPPRNGNSETLWHDVVVFGKQAESALKYLSKGDSVFIEGVMTPRKKPIRIRLDSGDEIDFKVDTYEIKADNVVFLRTKGFEQQASVKTVVNSSPESVYNSEGEMNPHPVSNPATWDKDTPPF